jgi:hypothetical protein
MSEKVTNKVFAQDDKHFKDACEKVKLPIKKHEKMGLGRQAGKWRRKTGLAYKEGRL